jgi:hypothetical protein
MLYLQRVAATLVVTGATALAASAQPPAPPTNPNEADTPLAVAAEHQLQPYRRRSIVHHYPYPYPEYYQSDQTAGFRNPGGGGRYLEYYPPGNQFQVQGDPVKPAQFDTGYGNRSEQLASQQIGIQRENAIMNHIDRYARPAFGVGFFGGFY